MNFRRRTAGWGSLIAGIVFILLGALMCFRSIERYYYAYGPATDDLDMRHIHMTWEIEAWAVTVTFVVFGTVLLRVAKTLNKSS
jgi:uncharacterized membrane protein HdeD (DUF308 family)